MGKKKRRRKKPKIKRTKSFNTESPFPTKVSEEKKSDSSLINQESLEKLVSQTQNEEIKKVFSILSTTDPSTADSKNSDVDSDSDIEISSGSDLDSDNDEGEGGNDGVDNEIKTKKQMKKEARISIAELKQRVDRPELVEEHDNNSPEPLLLIELKDRHNYIPVPKHWRNPKKYLQNKRGVDKKVYQLPEYIQDTGIEEIRNKINRKLKKKNARQRMRERMDPKMGKNDIDYEILHEAFFKYQKKPYMTPMGNVYKEGQEIYQRVKHLRPGKLSKKLKQALGMPDGAPPPWLINMQRYGPPKSYPWLRIPGVNAPLPPGAKWGYHPGGYGAPPRDENGKLLFNLFSNEEEEEEEFNENTYLWGEEEVNNENEENVDEEKIINEIVDEIDNDEEDDDDDEDELEKEKKIIAKEMEGDDDEEEDEKSSILRERPPPKKKENKPEAPPLYKRKPNRFDDLPSDEEEEKREKKKEKKRKEKTRRRKVDDDDQDFYQVVKRRERTIGDNTLVDSTFDYDLGNDLKKNDNDDETKVKKESDLEKDYSGEKRSREKEKGSRKKRKFKW